MSDTLEQLRLEANRSRAFLRSAETQLTKVLGLIDKLQGEEAVDREPQPEGALYLHEPAGFTPITERGFSRQHEGWHSSQDTERLSIVSDATAPVGGPLVGRMRYPAGHEGGWAPAWSEYPGVRQHSVRELYVAFWFKLSDNWQNHPVASKVLFLWTHEKPVVTPVVVGSSRLTTEVRIQDVPGVAVNMQPNLQPGGVGSEIVPGRWHQWELLVRNNTAGSADGEVHWWLDGKKQGAFHSVHLSLAEQSKVWEMVAWRPVWGGKGGTVREDMFMSMARIYVSGK